MTLRFTTEPFEWRGPAPFLFAAIPGPASDEIRLLARQLTYGWGVIPVVVVVGRTRWTTSLFPKDGVYLVPIKKAAQTAEGIVAGRTAEFEVSLG